MQPDEGGGLIVSSLLVLCTTWHKGFGASLDEFTVGSNGAVNIWFIFHHDVVKSCIMSH